MIGIIFALGAAVSSGVGRVLHRHLLPKHDLIAYSFVFHVLVALFLFPYFIISFSLPSTITAWWYVIISGILWILITIASFKAFQLLEVSVKVVVDKLRIIFVLLFGIFIFNESVSIEKLLGTMLIFGGVIFISYSKHAKKIQKKGLMYAFISTILIAIVTFVDKHAINFFNPGMFAFFSFFTPLFFFGPLSLNKRKEVIKLWKHWHYILAVGITAGLYYVFVLFAYKHIDASIVIPIVEISVLITCIGGIIFLHEKKNIWRKVISALIVIAGAIILSLH